MGVGEVGEVCELGEPWGGWGGWEWLMFQITDATFGSSHSRNSRISVTILRQRAFHSRRIAFLSQVPQFQHSAKQIQKHLSRVHWGSNAACRAAHLWPGTFHHNFVLNLDQMRLRLPGGAGSSSLVPFQHTIMSPLSSSSCEQEFKLRDSHNVNFWIIRGFFCLRKLKVASHLSTFRPWQIVFTQINSCNTSSDLEKSTSVLTLPLSASLCSGFFC